MSKEGQFNLLAVREVQSLLDRVEKNENALKRVNLLHLTFFTDYLKECLETEIDRQVDSFETYEDLTFDEEDSIASNSLPDDDIPF